jgi:hypothetical protein
MSLTRAQWEEMWKNVKKVEDLSIRTMNETRTADVRVRMRLIQLETDKMKDAIQSVIGQME